MIVPLRLRSMTRHTKRLAALASLVVALLGTLLVVPASAMASTSGSGPGTGFGSGPGQVTIVCPPPFGKPINVKVFRKVKVFRLLKKHPRRPVVIRIFCSRPAFPPGPKACRLQPLVFDVASGSSTLTEVSGPTLSPVQEFLYDGNIYTIMSVNPGADSFTVFLNNSLFTNSGAAITNGHGSLLCSPADGH